MNDEHKSAIALIESEQRIQQMFERNRSVKLIIDPTNGRIEDANPAACEFYGYSRERLLEMSIADINVLPPEAIQAEMALAQAETRLYFNFRHRLAGGELRDVEVYSGRFDTAHGPRLYSIIHDVTQRKRAEAQLRMFQLFSRHATDAHILLDEHTRIRYVNTLACELLGYSEAELLQMSVPDIDPSYDKARVLAHFEACKSGRMPPFETMHRRKDGSVFPVEITSTAVRFDGEWLAFTACRDITARKEVESELRLAASVFTHAQAGVMICDTHQVILDVNPAFTKITGYGRDEIVGQTPRRLSSGRHGSAFFRALWQAIEAEGCWEGEIWNRRKNGEMYPQRLTISSVCDPQGCLTHYIGNFTDISCFKQQQEQLEFLAHHDALTHLPNRALLLDRLGGALAHAHRAGTMLAVCYLDLDGFKAVNDQHGHAAGDALLIEVACRLKQGLRDTDTVARLGGDEFVLVLTALRSASDCEQAMTRLLRVVAEPIHVNGVACHVSASVGVCLFPDGNGSAEAMLRHADQAMYRAKQSGKDQYVLYDPVETA